MKILDFLKIKTDPNDVEYAKNSLFLSYEDNKAWDPSDNPPPVRTLRKLNAVNQAKYHFLKQNPTYAKKTFRKILFGSIVIGSLIVVLSFFTIFGILTFIGIGIILLPPIIFRRNLKNLGKDLIKLQIAIANNWLYQPEKDYILWQDYKKRFPEIFYKGNTSQHFEDIFWGAINKNNRWNNFVSGIFRYTQKSSSGKNGSSSTTYTNHFFIIRLPKKLRSRFLIYPENVFSKIGNFFTDKEINTESSRFNRTFAFSYNGKKSEKSLEIVKTLSPRVLEELLKLYDKKKKKISILFTENSVIFLSDGQIIPNPKTNLYKSIELDKADKDLIMEDLNSMIIISNEIVKYLD